MMKKTLGEYITELEKEGLSPNQIQDRIKALHVQNWRPVRMDSTGVQRTISVETTPMERNVVADVLAKPSEVWGWPQRHLYYLGQFEAQGVCVEVWGDVVSVHFTDNLDPYRQGLLMEMNK
jgi:hypothetical protein